MATATLNMNESRDSMASNVLKTDSNAICNGTVQNNVNHQINSNQKRQSSSSTREYINVPGEDDSTRRLIPKSSSSSKSAAAADKKNEPVILKDMNELKQHLELMHDRCIARNLRAAGLGGFEADEEVIYGVLDPNAHLITGETMLTATVLYIKEADRLVRVLYEQHPVAF